MNWLEPVVLVVHLLIAAAVCGFVLMQHGKGADMGAAFGSGSSGSLFGAAGSANFLSRTTAILATLFFVTSIGLTFFGTLHGKPQVKRCIKQLRMQAVQQVVRLMQTHRQIATSKNRMAM